MITSEKMRIQTMIIRQMPMERYMQLILKKINNMMVKLNVFNFPQFNKKSEILTLFL